MTEKAKRLEPTPEAKRSLFLRSGNLCAFPNCSRLMMDLDGNWVGQICHIEAAEVGGERFNSNMTNESRRSESNLLLMCYEHHVVTNDVKKFSVSKMTEIKKQHEERFANPEYRMFSSITDVTLAAQPAHVQNLKKILKVIKWKLNNKERLELVDEINLYINQFSRVPPPVRQFLGQFAARMAYLKRNNSLYQDPGGGEFIHVADLEDTFRLNAEQVRRIFSQMRNYRLGEIEEVHIESLYPPYGAFLFNLDNDWDFWRDIANFCEKEKVEISQFTEHLNFKLFDTE